jgi:hypothetical protein
MAKLVNSYRFLDSITSRMMKHWAKVDTPPLIPWSPLATPISQCTVSIVSSAGVSLKTDQPFDQEIERRDPWSSDPSYRVLPRATTTGDVRIYHLHINTSFAQQDLNCVMPLERLSRLEACPLSWLCFTPPDYVVPRRSSRPEWIMLVPNIYRYSGGEVGPVQPVHSALLTEVQFPVR